MSYSQIISELKTTTEHLKQLIISTSDNQLKTAETEKEKTGHLSVIVNHFHTILSSNFKTKKSFWDFISKHVNNEAARFCVMYEEDEIDDNVSKHEKKAKNWILFCILEKSFYNTYNELYEYLEDNGKIKNEKDLLIKYKKDIKNVLKELNEINFNNIFNPDYEKYLEYHNKNNNNINISSKNLESFKGSPILKKKRYVNTEQKKEKENNIMESEYESLFFDIIKIPGKATYDYFFDDNFEIDEKNEEKEPVIKKKESFEFEKKADFGPSIVDNFYNFLPKGRNRRRSIFEDGLNSNIIINSINEDDIGNSRFNNCEFRREGSGLIFHNENQERYLPSDKLYEIKNKTINKKEEIFYNKKKTLILNSHYFYLTQFYQKATSFKFYNPNLHDKIKSLEQQNYQCFICLKKFRNVLGFPLEPIYWCSYYLHFICKNCIADECSIIPHLILNCWCFDKCSISKKARNIIGLFYKEPIIYLKKKDLLLKKIPETVIRLKNDITNIYDYIKCDESKIIEDILPQHKYLVLKEKIFSLKDLVEIYNRTFIAKLKEIKNKLVNHITTECKICKYEGNICSKCFSEEKINFYDSENIVYDKYFSQCYHKKCKNLGI